MLNPLFYILLSFLVVSCNPNNVNTLYTVTSTHPKSNGTTDYLLVSEKGEKLVINKNNTSLWKIGKKISIEGYIPR